MEKEYKIIDITDELQVIKNNHRVELDLSRVQSIILEYVMDEGFDEEIIKSSNVVEAIDEYLSKRKDELTETIDGGVSDPIVILVYNDDMFIGAYFLTLSVSIDSNVNKIN